MNPAVKIDVMVNGDRRWSVYTFKNYPEVNMPMHDDIAFTFSMLDIKSVGSEANVEENIRYYTVLGFMRDRGIPFMWAGAVCMMLGLFFSFYVRPRRIWVLEKDGTLLIGAAVKGDSEPFGNFVKQTIRHTDIVN